MESFGKKCGYWTGWNYRIYFGSLFLEILTCYIIINIWASILYCKAERSSSYLIKLCVAADKPLIIMDQRQWSPPCNLHSQDKSLYLMISKSLSQDFIFSDLRLPPPDLDPDLISYSSSSHDNHLTAPRFHSPYLVL